MKLNCIPFLLQAYVIASFASYACMIFESSDNLFLAPTKFVAMSQYKIWQCPRRDMKRLSAPVKASVVRSLTNFKCTAFVAKQHNTCRPCVVVFPLVYNLL